MSSVSDSDSGTGNEAGVPITVEVLGNCLWCGHFLKYINPGDPPYDCLTDKAGFYAPIHVVRDFSLTDVPLDYGKFCPFAPPHPLGQFSVHQLVANDQQP